MCGIVGFVGEKPALPVLLDGLSRLEYRGYDSAGVTLQGNAGLRTVRTVGKIADLVGSPDLAGLHGTTGLGHTRWATHGKPSEENAHPHSDGKESLVIVHNGIIENHHELRADLIGQGVSFRSQTDSEVIAHLLGCRQIKHPEEDLVEAVRAVMRQLDGTFALGVMSARFPGVLVGVRRVAPLIVGMAQDCALLASDIPAILAETREVVVLEDDQIVELTTQGIRLVDAEGEELPVRTKTIAWDLAAAERGGYEHFMLKEIHEQPQAIADTLRGRIDLASGRLLLDELRIGDEGIRQIDKVFVVGCGTSYHAGLVAKYAIEHWARLPVEIDIASEFRYRDPVLDAQTLVVGVSQSGETIDTIAALRYAKDLQAKTVSVTNVVDSTMSRETDMVIYTHAGPEIGVAATKTFTAQIAALELFALYLAQSLQRLYPAEVRDLLHQMQHVPSQISEVFSLDEAILEEAKTWADVSDAFFLGRGSSYPTALEGALKMKEISYLHAEGYASGELKHGPLALIEEDVPVVAVATDSRVSAKTLSNVAEVEARGGRIIMIRNVGSDDFGLSPDTLFEVPATHELFAPMIDSVVLQLLSYHVATLRGCNVDKPRNLAKTVTVE